MRSSIMVVSTTMQTKQQSRIGSAKHFINGQRVSCRVRTNLTLQDMAAQHCHGTASSKTFAYPKIASGKISCTFTGAFRAHRLHKLPWTRVNTFVHIILHSQKLCVTENCCCDDEQQQMGRARWVKSAFVCLYSAQHGVSNATQKFPHSSLSFGRCRCVVTCDPCASSTGVSRQNQTAQAN